MPERIGIVGAGILGLAVARRILEVNPEAELTVLEKEREIGLHQTSHNSGVVHAGIYYAPGSLKANLCRRGMVMLKEFCAVHDVAYEECGKLVIARHADELSRLEEIERRARSNGVPRLRRVEAADIVEIEPHARGVAALHSPNTAIVDFRKVAQAIAREISLAGGQLRLGVTVKGFRRRGRELRVDADSGEQLAFDRVILCAGLQSDRLARLAGDATDPLIVPFRGEYLRLRPERADLVRGLVYPVPDPAYPFLGVHFTRRISGLVDIGPNAVPALAREGYGWRDFSLADTVETLRAPGFRHLARRHWRMGLREVRGSLSQRAFLSEARTYIPELRPDDVLRGASGVRAQAVDRDGSLVDDFRINELDGVVAIRNAPSPAATSCLAIAEYVVSRTAGSS